MDVFIKISLNACFSLLLAINDDLQLAEVLQVAVIHITKPASGAAQIC